MSKKGFIISTIILLVIALFIVKGSVNASQTITFNAVNNTTAVPTVVEPQNVTPVNNTTVPQTGENDTYIIAGVGAFAVVIGITAFALSKKNN